MKIGVVVFELKWGKKVEIVSLQMYATRPNTNVAAVLQGGGSELRRTSRAVVKHVRLCDIEPGEYRMGVLGRAFAAHDQRCAFRPCEVIIATLTVILATTSLSNKNYRCETTTNGHGNDHVRTSLLAS